MLQPSPLFLDPENPRQKAFLKDSGNELRIIAEFGIMKNTDVFIQDSLGSQRFDLMGAPKFLEAANGAVVEKRGDYDIIDVCIINRIERLPNRFASNENGRQSIRLLW